MFTDVTMHQGLSLVRNVEDFDYFWNLCKKSFLYTSFFMRPKGLSLSLDCLCQDHLFGLCLLLPRGCPITVFSHLWI
jgi:hypothetical protein